MNGPAATVANRLFEGEAWAQQRLAAHAGRSFVVLVGPVQTALTVGPSGQFEPRPLAGLVPDLTLTLSPLALPAFLAQPQRWAELVTASGDAALTATLAELAQALPWFVERSFAGVLGPVAGQRAADAGRRLLELPEYAAGRFGESLVRYARDEAGLLAGAGDFADFSNAAADLAGRADALAARIEALAARLAPPARE